MARICAEFVVLQLGLLFASHLQVVQLNAVGLTSKTLRDVLSFDEQAAGIGAAASVASRGVQVMYCLFIRAFASRLHIHSPLTIELHWLPPSKLYLAGNQFGGATAKKNPPFVLALTFLRPAVIDFSNCDLGAEGVTALALALRTCVEDGSLRSLDVGANVRAGKKAMEVGVALAALLDDEQFSQSKLRSLSIAGQEDPPMYLKEAVGPILTALASNKSLQQLVITGNRMGDDGVSALALALRSLHVACSLASVWRAYCCFLGALTGQCAEIQRFAGALAVGQQRYRIGGLRGILGGP